MKILVDKEGKTVISKLIDIAVKAGAFGSLQEAVALAMSVKPIPLPASEPPTAPAEGGAEDAGPNPETAE